MVGGWWWGGVVGLVVVGGGGRVGVVVGRGGRVGGGGVGRLWVVGWVVVGWGWSG